MDYKRAANTLFYGILINSQLFAHLSKCHLQTLIVVILFKITLLAISITISTFLSFQIERRKHRGSYSFHLSKFFSFSLGYIAVLLCFFYMYFTVPLYNGDGTDSDDLSSKITTISEELSISSNELMRIQKELESRIETVQELKKEAEIAENVISLSAEQVNAIQVKLNQELEQSNKKNTLTTIIVSAVFFGLGLIVNPIYSMIKKKISKSEYEVENLDLEGRSKEDIELALKMLDAVKKIDER